MGKSFFGEEEQKNMADGIAEAMEGGGEKESEQETETKSEEVEVEVENIKVGEKEYTAEELESLVGLGVRAKEVGDSHGGFDKYVSEFGKKSQRIGDLNKEIEEFKKPPVTEQGALSDEALTEAQNAARKLGIVMSDDVKGMVAEILKKDFDQLYVSRRSGEKLLDEVKGLEKDINGEDGRPKFESDKVLDFMNQNPGFTEPKQAYEAMHPDKMAQWRVDQIMNKKRGITTNTSTQSSKTPPSVGVNHSNLDEMMREALNT